jgi:hypothetical protein
VRLMTDAEGWSRSEWSLEVLLNKYRPAEARRLKFSFSLAPGAGY